MNYDFIDTTKVKEVLESGMERASELIKNNEQLNNVIDMVQTKIKETPLLGSAVGDLPVMVSMVKSYATKEYDVVSPKVIVTIVSAFLYLIKQKDLIKDTIPVLGQLDDIAVIVLAMNFIKPELNAYAEWKAAQQPAEA
ncbi:MAG: DUF1232 domain-containing protein [Erysipelotrichaceae bacterium]|nr:DUF1232 domain-containing protein [Erysipelotrichaceae bacterium]MBO4538405.1 DUF1232 domain-containing protein [Erysipelotrichaceae bacterium]MBR5048090.1 DUF1232 domain-containing protein [Erysipelotrichaceae bacterium]